MSISFTRLRKFSFIIFSNKVSISYSSSPPSHTPMIRTFKMVPDVPKPLLIFLKYFFKVFKKLFIFRERGREGKREGKKHQCVVAFHDFEYFFPAPFFACNVSFEKSADSLMGTPL